MNARFLYAAAAFAMVAALGTAVIRPQPMPSKLLANGDGVRAPEFPAGFTWYNTAKPLSIAGLRGKVVLLDFWTYGCINCMHILPDLKRLEAKYPKNLVVISVHSAKFTNESEAANIRNALLRYNIEHPVLVDQNSRVWSEYAVRAWPSFVLVDPAGRVIGQTAGEGQYDLLDETIAKTLAEFRPKGVLNETPLKTALERAKVPATPLWYPGKVAVNGGTLAIADSNHNRLVFTNRQTGKIEAIAGNGAAGFKDGDLAQAQFSNPQGLVFDAENSTWYVADTNNHAIRAVNLTAKKVTTLAGTGQQAAWQATGGEGTKAALSSPWDLYLHNRILYIAMAGPHQIWQMDLATKKVSVFAGSGVEARTDGTRATAAFAQPSGLASDGKRLFVADSESSSIRAVDLPETGDKVETLAGGDLFDFGDKGGPGMQARFQHPLGLAYDDASGSLFIADTYNSKIKRLDTKTGVVTTEQTRGLYEPGGIAFDDGKLFIADTNHNEIKRLDLTPAHTSMQFQLVGLLPPVESTEAPKPATTGPGTNLIALAPTAKGQILLDVKLPRGFHINPDAPQLVEVNVTGTGLKLPKTKLTGKAVKLPIQLPYAAVGGGKGRVVLNAQIAYCSSGLGAVCKQEEIQREFEYEIRAGGKSELRLPGAKLP